MASNHLYDPDDGGTDMEIVISPDTWWHAVCDDEIKLSNYDYENARPTGETCKACITKAKEQDPHGIIWNL
jgi:hypothetical protein